MDYNKYVGLHLTGPFTVYLRRKNDFVMELFLDLISAKKLSWVEFVRKFKRENMTRVDSQPFDMYEHSCYNVVNVD